MFQQMHSPVFIRTEFFNRWFLMWVLIITIDSVEFHLKYQWTTKSFFRVQMLAKHCFCPSDKEYFIYMSTEIQNNTLIPAPFLWKYLSSLSFDTDIRNSVEKNKTKKDTSKWILYLRKTNQQRWDYSSYETCEVSDKT